MIYLPAGQGGEEVPTQWEKEKPGRNCPLSTRGQGGWVGVALWRAALVGLRTERYRDVSPRRAAGEVEGRQAENAPHSTRPKWLEGQGAGARAHVGGRQQMLPSAPSSGKDPKTPASARVGRGQLRWGQAPPALQETPVAQWRVALSVRPTLSHLEDVPSYSGGGTAAGWLQQEDTAP